MWPSKEDYVDKEIAKLKAFRDIGETFNYLGRTCVVTGHWGGGVDIGIIPELRFNYCDDLGVIRSYSIGQAELPGLIKRQKSSKGTT